MKKKVLILFVLAFLIRLVALNQSLWLDEGTTARVVLHYSFFQVVTQFSPSDFHPPLFYLVEKIWTSIFGYSEVALRMPSVLFSLIAGWFVYKSGRFLKNEKTGLFSAALFLFNPLIIYYSQEARMYAMVLCFLAIATYFLILLLKKYSSQNTLYFNLALFFSFITFYGSLFYILALYFVLFVYKRKHVIYLLPGFVVAIVLISPLLFQQVLHSHQSLAMVANWKTVLGQLNLKNLILFPVKFVTGRVSFDPKLLDFFIVGIWTAFVFFFFGKGVQKNKVFGTLFILPLLLGAAASVVSPLLEYFRFIYLIIPLVLGISIVIDKYWQKVVLLFGFLVFSGVYLFFPQFYREDWKGLATAVPTQKVYAIPSSMDALVYYRPAIIVDDIRKQQFEGSEIVIIPYTMDIYGVNYKSIIAQKNYCLSKTNTFRGVTMEVWRSCR